MRVPEDARRDFVAGALIVEEEKVLLLDHDKYGIWLPPGGHVEEGETPDETAIRETKEETGLVIELAGSSGEVEENYIDLPRPLNVNLHKVEDGHWHCDYLYRAHKSEKKNATHDFEHNGTKWFSSEELRSENYEIPEYIREAATEAINSSED